MTQQQEAALIAGHNSRRAGTYLRSAVLALHRRGPLTALEMTIGTKLRVGVLRQQLSREKGREVPFLMASWGRDRCGVRGYRWKLTAEGRRFARQVVKEEMEEEDRINERLGYWETGE